MKRFLSSWTLLCVVLCSRAQIPAGYYESAAGSRGSGLKTALFSIITDHTAESYDELWTDMQKTDAREDGKVWDMYSSTTDFTFRSDQCGNYGGEGDCYNREHSFPKSWFNDAKPMYTDLFHLYPTDGYVNNRRSNYPFGETNGENYKSDGGFSKLGKSTVSGYSGTVFEPADEYKGDFARSYFYMITCYEDRITGWDCDMLDGKKYPGFASWALGMLLRWAAEDPVSEKETARNNAVYGIQHNRNPYIDFPGLEQYVWGDKTGVEFDPDNYEGGEVTPPAADVESPTFTPAPGRVDKGTTVTINTATAGAYIVYSLNGGGQRTEEPPVLVEITGPTTIEAYAMKDDKTSGTVRASYTIIDTTPDESVQVFRKVTSAEELQAGNRYLIVCEGKSTAMGAIGAGGDIRSYCGITPESDEIRTEVNREGLPYQMILGGTEGAYTLYDAASQVYLSLTDDKNKLYGATSAENDEAKWTITINDGGLATIRNNAYANRTIRYNASDPRFACYKTGQQAVSLYVNTASGDGLPGIAAADGSRVDVYTLEGQLVRRNVQASQALKGLKKGIYVVKGDKVLVK